MSTAQRQITLTETDDGQWRAQVEPDGFAESGETIVDAIAALGDTRTGKNEKTLVISATPGTGKTARALAVLAALDEADDDAADTEDVDPDAPLFSGEPFIDTPLGDESIDDVLYGPVGTDDNDPDPDSESGSSDDA